MNIQLLNEAFCTAYVTQRIDNMVAVGVMDLNAMKFSYQENSIGL
jgi:hypothetical protein